MPPKFSQELTGPVSFSGSPPENQPRTSPCEVQCPAGHAIQRTIHLIQNERFEEALENIWAKHPFPGTCGRACFHPCEGPCNRQFYDQSISIRALERAAYDLADRSRAKRPLAGTRTGKSVAIIGAGPAGLTCAYFSALLGQDVTLFDANPQLGGMVQYGIPDYRLPKQVVHMEISQILDLGVKAKTDLRIGQDIPFQDLLNHFDAVVIATGAWKDKHLNIASGEHALSAISLLRGVAAGDPPLLGERTLIVGGGGVALDAAGTARRLGVEEVHVTCVEPREGMPALEEDIRQAEAEGLILHNSRTVDRILTEEGQVRGAACREVRSFDFDGGGRLQVETVPGTEQIVQADSIVLAIGASPDFTFIESVKGFRFSQKGTLEVDERTLSTPLEGVFAAGDAVMGPGSIAAAIGSGRLAAFSVASYLSGQNMEQIKDIILDEEGHVVVTAYNGGEKKRMLQEVVGFDEILNPEYYAKENRVNMNHLPPEEAATGFQEIQRGYNREEAILEANRCFHCGHCALCGTCAEICPMDVIAMGEKGPEVVYPKECWHCGGCRINCPCGSVYYEFPLSMLI